MVVEEHHAALAWIHLGIRRRVLPLSAWRIVHWDAHPDLGAMRDVAVLWNSRKLQDYLDDSQWGISEWILPLVACGHVDRVDWVRPSFSNQIDDGKYDVGVGEYQGEIRVDSYLPYFVDDGASCDQLRTSQRFVLSVSENMPSPCAQPWLLDVCCDYFACLDPFHGETDGRQRQALPAGGARDEEQLQLGLDRFRNALACWTSPPNLVTIARSALDGYTPSHLVDPIQRGILAIIGDVYAKPLRIVYDLEGLGPLDVHLADGGFP